MAAAAAVVTRRQHDVVNAYRSAGATSPAHARDPNELGVEADMIFHGLIRRAVLREAGEGQYYLDVPSWDALVRARRRMAVVIGGIAVLLAILAVLGVVRLH